jgi:hypothetical protein
LVDKVPSPNVDPFGHEICLEITVDTGAGHPLFGFVGIALTMSDAGGNFHPTTEILTPNVDNHPIPDPPSFNTDDHWPVTVKVTAQVGTVRSWDLFVTTC